jgi:hypothetical protein
MAEIKSESVADFIPESVADLLRNQHNTVPQWYRKRIERAEDGVVTHDVDYPLDQRRGHGSAKFKK